MDISSGSGYPAANLSNFSPHKFIFRGVEYNSMEGLLQSFKFKEPHIQVEVCKLVGKQAKFRGKKKKWFRTQTLYWDGKEIDRHGQEYQDMLDEAFFELSKNTKFQKALLATNQATLTHSLGKKKESETILTTREFCSGLTKERTRLQKLKQSGEI